MHSGCFDSFAGYKMQQRPQMEGPQLTSPDQLQQKTTVSDVIAIAPGTIPDACKMHSRWFNNLPYSIIYMMRLHAMETMIDRRYKVRLLITWWPSRTYQHFVQLKQIVHSKTVYCYESCIRVRAKLIVVLPLPKRNTICSAITQFWVQSTCFQIDCCVLHQDCLVFFMTLVFCCICCAFDLHSFSTGDFHAFSSLKIRTRAVVPKAIRHIVKFILFFNRAAEEFWNGHRQWRIRLIYCKSAVW